MIRDLIKEGEKYFSEQIPSKPPPVPPMPKEPMSSKPVSDIKPPQFQQPSPPTQAKPKGKCAKNNFFRYLMIKSKKFEPPDECIPIFFLYKR